ncbi:MAG: polysaccharide pyruvyl transferase family protein [Oscillospiraceae bacterium]|nr:polysaccharide pyruvyl transferase family protein [Oscillospiraceae bacterium]
MTLPLVSWLMTVYNDECFLPRALDSMLCQTYPHFEVIVIIEHNCTDKTLEICEKYAENDSRVRLFFNDARLGFALSLNRGLYLCGGKYIARMDADDTSRADRLEKQVAFMEENDDIDILGSQMQVIQQDSKTSYVTKSHDSEYIRAKLLFSDCIVHPSVMLRKEPFIANDWIYTDCEAEDYALWTSLISKAKMAIYPEPLLNYYLHGDNACVVRFDEVRQASADISQKAILSELEIDASAYPRELFGWQDNDPVPYDLRAFLSQSAELLCALSNANERLCKFEDGVFQKVLTEQWLISKRIAKAHFLSDSFSDYSGDNFDVMLREYCVLSSSKYRAAIYGAGYWTRQTLNDAGNEFPFHIVSIFDSDENKQGSVFEGMIVQPPRKLIDTGYDIILVGSTQYFVEIKRSLVAEHNTPPEKIYDISIVSDMRFHSMREDLTSICSQRDNRKAYLFCSPDYGNLGDHAIAEAERSFVEGLGYELIEFPLCHHKDFSELARYFVKSDDLILITGGGFLGSLWFDAEKLTRSIIETFTENPIVILPQTVFWEDEDVWMKEIERTGRVYEEHRNLTICARDNMTYHFLNRMYTNSEVLLVPDMVLSLDWACYYNSEAVRKNALICLKRDKESILTDEDKEYIHGIAADLCGTAFFADTDKDYPISVTQRKNELGEILNIFRSAEVVITDRLHGMIFAVVMGTPCIILDNCSKKVSSNYEWLRHIPNIKLIENVRLLKNALSEVVSHGVLEYDSSVLSEKYNELKRLITNLEDN